MSPKMQGVTRGTLAGDDLTMPGPEEWGEAGAVAGLYIYPVKSMAAVRVDTFNVEETGPRTDLLIDRQLMVVDRKGKMITARRYPVMVMIQPQMTSPGQLTLSHPDQVDTVTVDLERLGGARLECEVWGEGCSGLDCGDEVASWITSVILSKDSPDLRLVYHNDKETSRPVREDSDYLTPLQDGLRDRPLFADGFPLMLVSQASLASLNTKLGAAGSKLVVEETRFRPNILISGNFEGFQEDRWPHVKINDNVFRNVKLCTRCVFTTVDPGSGTKDTAGEPLKTLRSFRSSLDPQERKEYGTSPFFGVNLGLEVKGGCISVGDKIMVRKNRSSL